MRKVLLVTLLASMIALPVSATPTGLIAIPSTDFVSQGTLHMDIDSFNGSGNNNVYDDYGLSYGFKNGEVGIDYLPDSAQDQAIYNLKFGVVNQEKFKVVVGAQGLGTGMNKQDLVYVMTSQRASDGTRFSLGYGKGNKTYLSPDEKVVMVGIDKQLSDKWWGAIDYISGDSCLGALSVGVSYAVAPNASLLVGFNKFNDSDVYHDTITTQIDINF